MLYYLIVFLTIFLLSTGLVRLKKPFFAFAYATSGLLNSMLESNVDEVAKQKGLIRSIGRILQKFSLLLVLLAGTIGLSLIPMALYMKLKPATVSDLDMSSFYFFVSMILGSMVLFVLPGRNKIKNKDYSDWSKLLHRMILDNYNISRSLFNLEKKIYKKKLVSQHADFVIITGLARGGTTALTNLLYESGRFHSLSYDNMPFLLSVNLWRKIYHPRKNKLKERAHGDNILFGYNTIEALEEYFFKVFLNDKFISAYTLSEHDIDRVTYDSYLVYHNMIRRKEADTVYLAKNNNLILRYKSLREHNPEFKIVMIFRSPVAHAYSLMNQHKRFSKMQKEDPFALEYMNWLGHHEFGLNHKVFDLELIHLREKYEKTSINYWISVWISYYSRILSLAGDENLFLIDYSDLCSRPEELLHTLGKVLNLDLTTGHKDSYQERELPELDLHPELKKQSDSLYIELKKNKVEILDPGTEVIAGMKLTKHPESNY